MAHDLWLASFLLVCFAAACLLIHYKRTRQLLSDFQGPPTYPICGTLPTLFGKDVADVCANEAWTRKYGKVIRYVLGGQPCLLITGAQEARKILNHSAADGRPYLPASGHHNGAFEWFFAFMSRNDPHSRAYIDAGRRVASQASRRMAPTFGDQGSAAMIQWLLKQPRGSSVDLDNLLSGVVRINALSLTYGRRVDSIEIANQDCGVSTLIQATQKVLASLDVTREPWGVYGPVQWSAPLLRHLSNRPTQVPLRREWQRAAGSLLRCVDDKTSGSEPLGSNLDPCVVRDVKALINKRVMSEGQGMMMASVVAAAALGTSQAALKTLIYALAFYRDHQAKLQVLLDAHMKDVDRLPTTAEEVAWPEITAFIREVMRLHPIMRVLFWKSASDDFHWRGKFIQKGTVLIPIISLINRDAVMYGQDADEFRPERYMRPLGVDGSGLNRKGTPITTTSAHAAFGIGRRACPGAELAERGLAVSLARLLHCFDIRFADDKTRLRGQTLEAIIQRQQRALLHHLDIVPDVTFVPRKAVEVIERQLGNSKAVSEQMREDMLG
ncbi:unnamed protein product [Parajaminaea phylloscopi]